MQCSLAGAVVFALLLVLEPVTQTVLIASLGASAFIAFAVPLSLHSSPRHIIGGYIVGIVAGCLMSLSHQAVDISPFVGQAAMIVFGAMAMAMAMFLMLTLGVVLAGAAGLSLFKRLVLPMLMDLL